MKLPGNLGIILLAVYLILIGISTLFTVAIPGIILGILALVSGILLIIGK